MPDKPFFAYYAPGATHAPHHVPKEWADKYKGEFDDGWDALRERDVRAPEGARRDPGRLRPDRAQRRASRPGTTSPEELKPVLARQMEIYAGYLENTDHHVGLLIDALEDLEILDDTLIYVIIGDNGASAEGSLQGTFNEMITLGGFGALETAEFMSSKIDEFGGPEAYNHYAVGWAHAMDTPYQWTKQVASHWGGTRNGTIVHWPNGIKAQGRDPLPVPPRHRRRADGARGRRPAAADDGQRRAAEADRGRQHGVLVQRRGRARAPRDAVLRDVRQPRHLPQGLDRGDQAPHAVGDRLRRRVVPAFDDDVWELYDTTTDWTQAHDLAERAPGQAARAAAAVADRGGQVQRRPARRPLRRARSARDGRAARR